MRYSLLFIFLLLTISLKALPGDEPPSPKHMGIHEPRLSAQQVLQLMLDDLKRHHSEDNWLTVSAAQWNQPLSAMQAIYSLLKENEASGQPIITEFDGRKAIIGFGKTRSLEFNKTNDRWELNIAPERRDRKPATVEAQRVAEENQSMIEEGYSAGKTFREVPLNAEYQIPILTRGVTEIHLNRTLFGAPEKSVGYYAARYSKQPPYVQARYLQVVLDPVWNRLVYGNLGRWIKSYDDLLGPAAIAVDPNGRFYIGEQGRQRITVLTMPSDDSDGELSFAFSIDGITSPSAIAHHNNQTPFNPGDDILYVADGVDGVIYKFAVDENGGQLLTTFEGFESPSSLLCGMSFGNNNRLIYVVDQIGKRLQVLEDDGGELTPLKTVYASPNQYFSDIQGDYFGNVYLSEQINSRLYKFSPKLELLDIEEGSSYQGLTSIHIPFGKVTIEGEGTFWVGYDQLLALERWSQNSGVQRRQLSLAVKNFKLLTRPDSPTIVNQFLLTDVGEVSVSIESEQRMEIRHLPSVWMNSGSGEYLWDRRDEEGEQVPPGYYRYRFEAKSPYNETITPLNVSFYLPLYYWQDCGSTVAANDRFRIQGEACGTGESPEETGIIHPDKVIYRFVGLSPERQYELAVQGYSGDGIKRQQRIIVNGEDFGVIKGNGSSKRPDFWRIPTSVFQDGVLTVAVENVNEGDAAVSQIWLKEVGSSIEVQQLFEDRNQIGQFVLEQNYPNPFNPSTTIQYQVLEAAPLRLEIFNLLGQRIQTMVDGYHARGTYTIHWDGRDAQGNSVASGIYFYRLQSKNSVLTKRMLLLR
ncbi:MAG: T9SS C-terminal target domain-containing protein [Calditrichaeota bacterium]|nr:MAG: T9SS C-terminal target domain-containing protein [Calditrichota bacterium]